MDVLVPFAASGAKSRLDPVLSPDERDAFARAMLSDVLAALDATDASATVLATGDVDCDAPVTVDDRGLDAAINERLAARSPDDAPLAVVMADLALATPAALERLFATAADVAFAPGRGGGTNAVVVRHPDFRVDYHGASIRDHRAIAAEVGASVAEVDSYRLATDVDEPADLAEVLLHTDGAAAEWLADAGFELVADGRVTVERH